MNPTELQAKKRDDGTWALLPAGRPSFVAYVLTQTNDLYASFTVRPILVRNGQRLTSAVGVHEPDELWFLTREAAMEAVASVFRVEEAAQRLKGEVIPWGG